MTSEHMSFYLIVSQPDIARFASEAGADRLFVDLEYMGKDLRQKGLDTWKSRHTSETISTVREAAEDAHLLVRVNPLHTDSQAEIDDAIERGADSVMLPMFHTCDELARFFDMLRGRAEAVPLVETKAALDAVPDMVAELPLTQLHIGLNDLHLDMGYRFMFQPLADGVLEDAAAALRAGGIAFGVGGLARAREGIVGPEYLLGEHVRLGSTAAILSRTFHRGAESLEDLHREVDFEAEVAKLRSIYAEFKKADAAELERNRTLTQDRIADVVRLLQKNQDT